MNYIYLVEFVYSFGSFVINRLGKHQYKSTRNSHNESRALHNHKYGAIPTSQMERKRDGGWVCMENALKGDLIGSFAWDTEI